MDARVTDEDGNMDTCRSRMECFLILEQAEQTYLFITLAKQCESLGIGWRMIAFSRARETPVRKNKQREKDIPTTLPTPSSINILINPRRRITNLTPIRRQREPAVRLVSSREPEARRASRCRKCFAAPRDVLHMLLYVRLVEHLL